MRGRRRRRRHNATGGKLGTEKKNIQEQMDK
jgi:hypothetical protein